MRIYTRRALGLLMVAGFLAAPAGAGRPDPGPETPLQRIDRKMGKIRAHFTNASVRMKVELNQFGSGAADPDSTFMRQCCSSNLKTILDASRLIYDLLDDLSGCYEAEQNPTGISGTAFFREDLLAFAKTMSDLENAPGKRDAEGAYMAATRAYNKLRATGDELPDCSAIILDPEQSAAN